MIDIFYFYLVLVIAVLFFIIGCAYDYRNYNKISVLKNDLEWWKGEYRKKDNHYQSLQLRYDALFQEYWAAVVIASRLIDDSNTCVLSKEDLKRIAEEIEKKDNDTRWAKLEKALIEKKLL